MAEHITRKRKIEDVEIYNTDFDGYDFDDNGKEIVKKPRFFNMRKTPDVSDVQVYDEFGENRKRIVSKNSLNEDDTDGVIIINPEDLPEENKLLEDDIDYSDYPENPNIRNLIDWYMEKGKDYTVARSMARKDLGLQDNH